MVFALGESSYCRFVDACLKVLQWSPLAIAGPMLMKNEPAIPMPEAHAENSRNEKET